MKIDILKAGGGIDKEMRAIAPADETQRIDCPGFLGGSVHFRLAEGAQNERPGPSATEKNIRPNDMAVRLREIWV